MIKGCLKQQEQVFKIYILIILIISQVETFWRVSMVNPIVFISYSHKDEAWKNRLVSHLGVLQSEGLLGIWDDTRIEAGADWYPNIQKAIDASNVAILLISADFLTSKFILGEEVPRLLERREKEGLRIFPVIVKPCAWQHVKWFGPNAGKTQRRQTDLRRE